MKSVLIGIFSLIAFGCLSQKYEVVFELKNPSSEINSELINLKVNGTPTEKTQVDATRFKILLNQGQHSLLLTHIGFKTLEWQIDLYKNLKIQYKFDLETNTLDEVTVSQTKSIDIERPTIGLQKISIKELSKIPVLMGEIDIQRGLQTLPGVSSVGEGANGLNIRGGSSDQNLILLEGTPIYNPTHLFGLFSVIPSEAIGTIELYKGAIPTRFGGRVASVIDLRSKDPSLNQTIVQGGIGLIASKLAIETPIIKDKMAILVASRSCFTGFLLQGFRNLKQFDGGFNELFGKLIFKPSDSDKISVNFFGTNDFTKLIGIALNPEGNNSEDSEISYKISNFSTKWNHVFKNKKSFTNLLLSNATFTPKIESPDPNLTIAISNQVINRKANFELTLALPKENQIELGIETQLNEIQPANYFQNNDLVRQLPLEKSLESAIYSSFQAGFGKKLKTDIGLRYSFFHNLGASTYRVYSNANEPSEETVTGQNQVENNKVFNSYGGLEPRISLAYTLNNRSSLKANFTVARQYIQIVTNNTTPLPVSRWKTSDIYIKPQIGTMYSIGYFLDMENSKSTFSVESYYRFTQNYTDVKMGSNFLLKDNVETELLQGLNRAYGIETMYSKQFAASVLSMNYTYSRSFNKITGNTLFTQINSGEWYRSNFDRPHSLNAQIKIQQSAIHHFSFAFTFASGRPFTAPEGIVQLEGKDFPIYINRNNARIPAYHRVDFSWIINNPAQKQGKYQGNWAFNVYNLYARKNIYSVFYSNKIGSLKSYSLAVFASAIPSISYNFTFK